MKKSVVLIVLLQESISQGGFDRDEVRKIFKENAQLESAIDLKSVVAAPEASTEVSEVSQDEIKAFQRWFKIAYAEWLQELKPIDQDVIKKDNFALHKSWPDLEAVYDKAFFDACNELDCYNAQNPRKDLLEDKKSILMRILNPSSNHPLAPGD